MAEKVKFILLDADVIVHFYRGEQILLLKKLYPNRLKILDKVVNELKGLSMTKEIINNFLNFRIAEEISFPNDPEIIREYARLMKEGRDKGESACMAYLRFNNHILASSNLKHVQKYCIENDIELITTMDILLEIFEKEMLSESECDYFIYNVTSKGSKLPFKTIKEYLIFKKGK